MNSILKIPKKVLNKYQHSSPVLKATIWFMVCSILQKAISLITVPIFTRMLTQEQYGQYAVYNSWQQIFSMICTLRLEYSVFNKGMSKYKDRRDEYTTSMQGLTNVTACIMLVVYLIFRQQVNDLLELPTIVVLFMILELLFTPAISFWSLRKRYDYKYRPVVVLTLMMSVFNPALGVVLVSLSEDKGLARIFSCIIVQMCFGVTIYILNLCKNKKMFSWDLWKFAFLFNLPLIPHYFSMYILDQSDRIMIQKMVSLEAVALYSIAYNAGAIMKIVTTSMNSALVPWQYRKLENKEFDTLEKRMTSIFLIVALIVVAFSVFAPELVLFFGGEKYMEAVYVIPPVSASLFFIFVYGMFANVELFYDANKFTMFISMFGAGLNLLLNYIAIPIFGYVAAGYTTLICYVIFSIGHYMNMNRIAKKKTGSSIYKPLPILLMSAMVIVLSILVSFLYMFTIVRYAVVALILVATIIFRKTIKSVLKTVFEKD